MKSLIYHLSEEWPAIACDFKAFWHFKKKNRAVRAVRHVCTWQQWIIVDAIPPLVLLLRSWCRMGILKMATATYSGNTICLDMSPSDSHKDRFDEAPKPETRLIMVQRCPRHHPFLKPYRRSHWNPAFAHDLSAESQKTTIRQLEHTE